MTRLDQSRRAAKGSNIGGFAHHRGSSVLTEAEWTEITSYALAHGDKAAADRWCVSIEHVIDRVIARRIDYALSHGDLRVRDD